MFGFDEMFDFNRDGELDNWERGAEFLFLDSMLREDGDTSAYDDDPDLDDYDF